jgi:hypothetical protein
MRYIVDVTIEVEADSTEEAEAFSLQLFRPGLAKERLNFILKGNPEVSCVTLKKDLEPLKPAETKFVTDLDAGD